MASNHLEQQQKLQSMYEELMAGQDDILAERQRNMDGMLKSYLDDESLAISPERAGLASSMRGFSEPGGPMFMDGFIGQLVRRSLAKQDMHKTKDTYLKGESDNFKDLQQAVINRMLGAQNGRGSWKPEIRMAPDGTMIAVDPNNFDPENPKASVTELYSTYKGSPIYLKLKESIEQAATDPSRKWPSEEAREAWKEQELSKALFTAYQQDSRRIGGEDVPHRFPGMEMSEGAVQQPMRRSTDRPAPAGEPIPNIDFSKERNLSKATKDLVPESRDQMFQSYSNERNIEMIQGELDRRGISKEARAELEAQLREEEKMLAQKKAGGVPSPTAQTPSRAPGTAAMPTYYSPEQRKADETLGAEQAKQFTEYKDQVSSFRNMDRAIDSMQGILASGKTTAGAAHEMMNKMGNWINYIDPNSSLAKATHNDAVYYGKLMDLVRDKIKALGAGTAVSNLDLIVSQLSLGDLRNTPEGNSKLLGLIKTHMKILMREQQNKIRYYEENGTFKGWKAEDVDPYVVLPRRNKEGFVTWDPLAKEDWFKMTKRANPKATDEAIEAAWPFYVKESYRRFAGGR